MFKWFKENWIWLVRSQHTYSAYLWKHCNKRFISWMSGWIYMSQHKGHFCEKINANIFLSQWSASACLWSFYFIYFFFNISRVFLFLSHTWCVDILWNIFDDEYAILTIFRCVILIMIKVMKIWVEISSSSTLFFDDLMGKYSWQLILFDWLI